MKRKLLCKDCALGTRNEFPGDQLPQGHNLKFDVGLSREDLYCDSCGGHIGIGRVTVAMTFWDMDLERECSYLGWWKQYITPTDDFDPTKMIEELDEWVEGRMKNAGG